MSQSDNPYRFVATEAEAAPSEPNASSTFRQPESGRKLDANDVRILAFAQRGLLVCLCVLTPYAAVTGLANVFDVQPPQVFAALPTIVGYVLFFGMLVYAVGVVLAYVAGLVFVFAIGRRVHRLVFAILFALFAFSPPFLFPIYLYLHLRANHVLKRHGIAVRWYGAPMLSLPRPNLKQQSAATAP